MLSFKNCCRHFALFCSLFLMLACTTLAEDWNQFRGAKGDGLSSSTDLPVDFASSKTVWKTAIPGMGWSSPVVSDGYIWITTAEASTASAAEIAKKTKGVQFAKIKTVASNVKLQAVCVDAATGAVVHSKLLRDVDDPDLINPLNSYASPTCAIVGDRVICHFGSYGTWCMNKKTGEELWKNALVIDHSVGPGSSPIVADGIVLIVCDGIDQQFVAGLDLTTGEQVWRTARPKMRASNGEFQKAYSTPLIIDVDGNTQAVIPGAQWMCAYDPKTGDEIWRADCGNGFSTTPMAVYEAGLVVCSTGFMSPNLVAVNPAGSGDVTKSHIVWNSSKGGSTMPTAVASGGLLYSMSDDGRLSVLSADAGKIVNQKRIQGKFAASPLLADGKLYLSSQEGVMTVLSVPQLENLAKNKMDGGLMASPAVLGSDLIVRTDKSLMRIAK